MKPNILDASALLALLNQESGFSIVEKLLPSSIMSTINVSEVISELYLRLNIPVQEGKAMVEGLIHEIISFDIELATKAAELRKNTQHLGLSLGDRACIALGLHLNIPVYTADKIWQKFSIPSGIHLIR